MNKSQIDYLLQYYQTKSVKELAGELGLDRKEVQRELRKVLAERHENEAVGRSERRPHFHPQPWFYLLLGLFALVFVFWIYARSLSFPFLNWDDPRYVTENSLIRNFSRENLKTIFTQPHFSLYIPFTLLSYAVDYHFSHFNSFGYHLTNLLFHLANTALVFTLVRFLTGEWLVGLAVALIFGVHPVQIESVVWIAERKNVLSTFFFLGAFLAYVFSRRKPGYVFLPILSVLIFLAAGFSKPNVVILPLLLLAFDHCYSQDRKVGLKRHLVFWIGAFFFALVTYWITRTEGKMNYHGGNLGATLLTMMVVMMKYLELLIFPARQSLLYEFPVYGSLAYPQVALSFFALLLLGSGLFYLWVKNRKLFFWGAWYFIFLLPVMNLIPFPSLMNDRYLYLPLIGFFTLLFLLLKRFSGPALTTAILLLSVCGFTFLNVRRQAVWAEPERLWLETQSKTRESHQSPYLNLGMYYLRQSEYDKAIEQFNKVLTMLDYAQAYDGLGIAYSGKGDYEKAIDYFKKAIARAPTQAGVHSNLAVVYQKQKNFELALQEFQEAVKLAPREPKYRNNMGSILMETGNDSEAEKQLLAALAIDPDFDDALYNLGLLYANRGHQEGMKKYWSHLLKIHPHHAKAAEVQSKLGLSQT